MRTTVLALLATFSLATTAVANPVLYAHQATSDCREQLDMSVAYVSGIKKKGGSGVRLTVKKNKDSGVKNAEFRKAKDALLACVKAKLDPQSIKVTSN